MTVCDKCKKEISKPGTCNFKLTGSNFIEQGNAFRDSINKKLFRIELCYDCTEKATDILLNFINEEVKEEKTEDIIVKLRNMFESDTLNKVLDSKCYNPNEDLQYFYKNGKIYITKNVLQIGMDKYLEKTCSLRNISDAMHDAGILEEDNDSRTKKFASCRHYIINYYLLEKYCM